MSSVKSRAHISINQVVNDDQAIFATDNYINMTLLYLLRKATEELNGFPRAKVLKKIGVEVDGVILSKGRIMQGMEFLETAEVDMDLGAMGIRSTLPLLDRHSPLSYAIAQQCPYPVCGKAGKADNQSCRDRSWLLSQGWVP